MLADRIRMVSGVGGNNLENIIKGDENAGLYGIDDNLISASDFFSKAGVTEGVSLISGNIGWIKFSYNRKVLYTPVEPLRKSLHWYNLETKGCVFGSKIITIEGSRYRVRLFLGAKANPSSRPGGEWDALMVAYASDLYNPKGLFAWCQEQMTPSGDNEAQRMLRGGTSISGAKQSYHSFASPEHCWTPVLELIQ